MLELTDRSDVYLRVRLEAVPAAGGAVPEVSGSAARALVAGAVDAALEDFMGSSRPRVDVLSCDVVAGAGHWAAHALLQTRLGAVALTRAALALARPRQSGCPLVFVGEAVAPALVSVATSPHAFEEHILRELLAD